METARHHITCPRERTTARAQKDRPYVFSGSFSLRSVTFQAKFTAIAVDLKRIAALFSFVFRCFQQSSMVFGSPRLPSSFETAPLEQVIV